MSFLRSYRTISEHSQIASKVTNSIQIKAFSCAVIDCSTSCVFLQTGLVQTEEERLFISPVGQAANSFSGWEHRVIREIHSSSDGPATAADSSPKFCQTIQGETALRWNVVGLTVSSVASPIDLEVTLVQFVALQGFNFVKLWVQVGKVVNLCSQLHLLWNRCPISI